MELNRNRPYKGHSLPVSSPDAFSVDIDRGTNGRPSEEARSAAPNPDSLSFLQTPQARALPAPVDQPSAASEKPLYKIWPGNNMFCCFGKCITGPPRDFKYVVITWSITLGFTVAYCVLAVPVFLSGINCLLPIFSGVLLIISIIFYFMTAYSDPGIIPRKEIFELFGPVPEQYTERVFNKFSTWALTAEERTKLIQSFKYCSTCKIFRPPRASHCAYYFIINFTAHVTKELDIATTA